MPILFILLAIALIIGIWITFSFIGMLVSLAVALIVGLVADRIVPGELPYGWLGAIVAGLAGSWLGTGLMGEVGPTIAGIAIFPALVGAIVLAFAAEFLSRALSGGGRTSRPTEV